MMKMMMNVLNVFTNPKPAMEKAVEDTEQRMEDFKRKLEPGASQDTLVTFSGFSCSLETACQGNMVFREYVEVALALLAVTPEPKRGEYLDEYLDKVSETVKVLLKARHECPDAAGSTKLTQWFADTLVAFANTPGFGGVHELLFGGLRTSPGNLADHLTLLEEQKATLRSLADKVASTSKYERFFMSFIDFLDGRLDER